MHLLEKYQPCVMPTLYKGSVFVTRGNDLRLEKSHVKYKYDVRKFGLSNGAVNTWNSLPTGLYLLTLLTRLKRH